MITPRVTEIRPALPAVEPDPFLGAPARGAGAQRRLDEREARLRQAELVRRMLRARPGAR